MSSRSPAEIAERLSQRRAKVLWFQALLFLLWQMNFFASPHGEWAQMRNVDHFKISAFVIWAMVLLLMIATGGGWFRSKEVRELLNDESTRVHRQMAQASGFWAAMAASLALYLLSLFSEVKLVEAVHLVLSAGIFAVLIRFAYLERRAHRD
jgi:magnesium-transporting ATPase (P-type)